MIIKIVPQEGYWSLTHDVQSEGRNDPRDIRTWDWGSPSSSGDATEPKVSINGSAPLNLAEVGDTIKLLVQMARDGLVGEVGCINLYSPTER